MGDWYVGQQIVCINIEPLDGGLVEPEILKYLEVGKVFIIRQIVDFPYLHLKKRDIRLGFRLAGIKPVSKVVDGKLQEYAFWSERFKPLEEDETSIHASVPETMKDWLKAVVDGTVVFEPEKELETIE